jgi:hypothetical protein
LFTADLNREIAVTATRYMTLDTVFVGVPPGNSADHFDDFTDRFMDALCDFAEVDTDITDPDITASLTDLTISVYVGVTVDTQRDAERWFASNVRTALHAAGCYTQNWPFQPASKKLPKPREVDRSAV